MHKGTGTQCVLNQGPKKKKTKKKGKKTMRKYNLELHSTECDQKSLGHADVVVIVTNHDNLDYEMILQHSNLVVDTRGVYKPGNKVISA